MKTKNIEPGDVEIRKIQLYKWGSQQAAPIDLLGQTISFSIYEDVEEPSMLLEITLVDSLNLLQNYPIIGEEIIDISFVTPGRENVYKKTFYVYNVENVSNNPNAKASTYTLKAVTPLHYFSSRFIIKKSYNNTVDEIVRDIVNSATISNGLGTTRIYTESTKGLIPITIPSLTAFEAIDYIRQRAISAEYPSGGVFLFFENQYGYQFRSIEGIISEGKKQIATKEFTFAPATGTDKQRSQYSFRNILNYQNNSRFDSVSKVASGVVNNTVEAFNVLTKQTEIVRFNLAEKAKTFASADSKSRLPNSTGFMERFNNTDKNYFMSKDSSKGNDYLDSLYGSKNSYSLLLNENVLRVLINGDSYISAGDVVKLNLPDTSGTSEKKAGDRMNSGNYIITKLRHIISTEQGAKPKHQIAFDCARMGYK